MKCLEGDIKSKECLFLIGKICSYLCADGQDPVEKGPTYWSNNVYMGMNGILSRTMGLALNKSEQLMKTRRKIDLRVHIQVSW